MGSIDSILDAAAILSRISDVDRENLLVHRAKFEDAYRNLKSLLKDSDEIASGKNVLSFLDKNGQNIKKWFMNAGEPDNKSEGDWAEEDPRIVDLSIVDQKCSLDEMFRAGLSAINLASTYTTWEQDRIATAKRRRKTRVDTLCDNLDAGNRATYYKEYVDASDNFRDKKKAKHYIEYGVKYLVFGKIFVRHMRVYVGDMPTDVHFGVLGILFLTTYFRRVTYRNIPSLVNAILSSDWGKLAEEKSEWMSSRLEQNDGKPPEKIVPTVRGDMSPDRIERILAHRRRKHNLEEENFDEHRNKRPRSENVITVTSNNAALQDSLDNLLEVDPLGLPYFDYPLGRTLNSTDIHVRSQERDLQDTVLADLSRLDQFLTVNPLGPPYFEGSRPQDTPPLPLPASPATIPTERIDTEVARFLAGLGEKGDGTSNIADSGVHGLTLMS